MTFLLAITDFSTGEGVYTADMVAALAPRLGYSCVAGWDRGLHGWPKLRGAALEAGLTPVLGCRFAWREMAFGAFPHSNRGYAELCRLLTDQAHSREGDPFRSKWRTRSFISGDMRWGANWQAHCSESICNYISGLEGRKQPRPTGSQSL